MLVRVARRVVERETKRRDDDALDDGFPDNGYGLDQTRTVLSGFKRHFAFKLARMFKAVPGIPAVMRSGDVGIFGPAVAEAADGFVRRAAKKFGVEPSQLFNPAELWGLLCEVWPLVGEPGDVISRSLLPAKYYPITLKGRLATFGPTFRTVASLAYWIGNLADLCGAHFGDGDGTFTLPQADVGLWLYTSHTVVGSHIRMLVHMGLLECTDEHWKPLRRAKRYRFCSNRIDLYEPPDIQALDAARRKAHGIADPEE
jgi:hypothetical protein